MSVYIFLTMNGDLVFLLFVYVAEALFCFCFACCLVHDVNIEEYLSPILKKERIMFEMYCLELSFWLNSFRLGIVIYDIHFSFLAFLSIADLWNWVVIIF
jgi:hypothetical protein